MLIKKENELLNTKNKELSTLSSKSNSDSLD